MQDILIAQGVISDTAAINAGLGLECAGVVTEVGPGVKKLKSGDRVAAISSGSFTTSQIVPQTLCSKIPDEMDWDVAASIPVAYCTVIHGMIDQGRLSSDKVRDMSLLCFANALSGASEVRNLTLLLM